MTDRPATSTLQDSTDAQMWAKEWIQTAAAIIARTGTFTDVLDEGWMIGWFANAIETGRRVGRQELCPHTKPIGLDVDMSVCRICGKLLEDDE